MGAGGGGPEPDGILDDLQADGRRQVGLLGRTNLADRIPVLAPGLGLARLQEGEVGLVVGKDPGHQLDVGTVGIGEVAVPGIAEFVVAPGPLLLAGGDVVVGDMDQAGPFGMVVAAEEILLRAHAHVRGRHRDVGIPGEIVGRILDQSLPFSLRQAMWRHEVAGNLRLGDTMPGAGGVIDPIVVALAERIGAGRALGVVGDIIDIGREEALVLFVDPGGDIRPPQEGLRQGGPVVGADLQLDAGRIGMEADPVHPLHPHQRIMVAQPDSERAIRLFLDAPGDRHEGGRPMMLRPVELDPARSPWSGQANQRRLDDILPVEDVIAIGLVGRRMDPPADLRQDHHFQVLVLQEDRRPLPVALGLADPVVERQRIDTAIAPLVNPLLQEHRVLVRSLRLIRGNGDLLGPGFDSVSYRFHGCISGWLSSCRGVCWYFAWKFRWRGSWIRKYRRDRCRATGRRESAWRLVSPAGPAAWWDRGCGRCE